MGMIILQVVVILLLVLLLGFIAYGDWRNGKQREAAEAAARREAAVEVESD